MGSDTLLTSLADVPTFIEAGYPGFEACTWTALVAPAGVPRAIVNRLAAETVRALMDSTVQERLSPQGAIATSSTPKELEDKTRFEIRKWAQVIQDAKIPRVTL